MSKENYDFIETAKNMVVEYYNRYVRQLMNRHPRTFKRKISKEDVNIIDNIFADNIQEITLNTNQDENLVYRVLIDMDTKKISSYTIKRKKEGE